MDEIKIIILFIAILFVSLLHLVIRKHFGGHLIHLYFFSGIWFLLLCFISISDPPFQISNKTFSIFSLAWVLVYLGNLLALILTKSSSGVVVKPIIEYNNQYLRISLIIILTLSIIGNLLFYRTLLSLLNSGDGLIALRGYDGTELMKESSNLLYNIFGRIYVIYIPLALYLFKQNYLKLHWLILIIILAILTSIGTFTRAPLLFLLIIIISSIYILKIKIPKNVIILTCLGFIVLFGYTSAQIFEFMGEEINLETFANFFADYFLGSLVAFEELLEGHYYDPEVYHSKFYSLDFINYFLNKVGLLDSYPSLIRNYSSRVLTNVYTYLDVFQLDFGLLGLTLGPLAIGLLVGFLSGNLHKKITIQNMILYIYCVYGLSFTFMNNEFIRSYLVIVYIIALSIHLLSLKKQSTVSTQI